MSKQQVKCALWYVDQYHSLGTQRSLVLVGGDTSTPQVQVKKLTPYLTEHKQIEIQQSDGNYVTTGDSHKWVSGKLER